MASFEEFLKSKDTIIVIKIYIFLSLICSSFVISCSNKSENNYPRYVLIVYLGEMNHPVSPYLILTNPLDTTYSKYIGSGKEKLEEYGFIITETIAEDYLEKVVVDNRTFNILQKFIERNDTKVNNNIWQSNNSTWKIILESEKKTLVYTTNNSKSDLFDKLIDILNHLKEEPNDLKFVKKICLEE